MNYNKIRNWTKIWVAFTNFVVNYKTSIVDGAVLHKGNKYPISLETMVALSYPKSGLKLIEYMRKRRTTFKTSGEEVDYEKMVLDNKSLKSIIRN